MVLSSFSSNTSSKLNILGHDSNTLGMDSTQIGVFKEADQVGFAGLLQGPDGGGLEAQVSLEVLGDFTDKTLELQLSDQQLSALLVATNLTSDGTWALYLWLLDTTSTWGTLTGGQLFTWSLSTS